MGKLSDKVIWITGASSGIGEALAFQLSRQNVKLIISARREEELQRVKERCGGGDDIRIICLDLAESDSMPAKVKEALACYGQVDILVNNGGISQRSLIKDTPMEVDRRVMEVNYFGTIALTKAILPHMIAQQAGHIAVVTSAVGIITTRYRSGYAAAKHALHGFFDTLRIEHHADNIKVTLILPGSVLSNASQNALMANGQPQNKIEEAHLAGLTSEQCASRIISAIETDKEEAYVAGIKVKFGLYLKRWWPTMFSKMIRKAKVT